VVPLLWKNHPTDKSNIYLVRDNIIGIVRQGFRRIVLLVANKSGGPPPPKWTTLKIGNMPMKIFYHKHIVCQIFQINARRRALSGSLVIKKLGRSPGTKVKKRLVNYLEWYGVLKIAKD